MTTLTAWNVPDGVYRAGQIDDPQERYIKVLQYYLAGWHIKPKGVYVN